MSRIKSKKHISYMNLRDIDLRKVVNESVNMFFVPIHDIPYSFIILNTIMYFIILNI